MASKDVTSDPMKYLLIFPCLLFLSACNISAEAGGAKASADIGQASTFSYDYTENGCPTGKKDFSSMDALCEGLRDEAKNNNCARNLRYERFKQDCPGKTW
jgi:hypothetical protein